MKRFAALALICAFIISTLAGCGVSVHQNDLPEAELSGGNYGLSVAVLYNGEANNGVWQDTLSRFEQPLMLGLSAEAVDVTGEYDLSGYDILYPDMSITTAANASSLRDEIVAFANGGGAVYCTNGFYDFFPAEFFGAESFSEVPDYPYHMEYPDVSADLQDIQDITRDFYTLYEAYAEFPELEQLERGVGMVPDTAVTIASKNGLALSAVNRYGEGWVFFCSGLLPNPYYTLGTSLTNRTDNQRMLSDTALSAARILENSFASFVSKRTVGYSVWRVFGSHGNPAMTWELHFEELTGFENGSGVAFAEMLRDYLQIPSYTLIRNSYTWFLRAETVTSLLGQSADAMSFVMDLNESAYSSGTHAAAGDEWLTLFEIEDGGSYFVDDTKFDQRAYPEITDLDGDGILDIVAGSSDGGIYFFRGLGYDGRIKTEEAVKIASVDVDSATLGYSAPTVCDIDGDGVSDILCGTANGNIYLLRGEGDLEFSAPELYLETGLEGQALPDVGDLNGDGSDDLVVGSNARRLLVYYGGANGFGSAQEITVSGVEGSWVAPCVVDLDGDGLNDLALGTFDGYIARLINNGSGFDAAGYIELDEMNYKGNYNAKFGNNCVPRFADVDGDGITDLVCGSLEYGMNYPIDSEYFPYREELQAQLDYFKENGYYVGVHFYTNDSASPEREAWELEHHLDAMRSYGLDTTGIGANQHSWYTCGLSPVHSFMSHCENGILFNTGFAAPNDPNPYPQTAARNVISLPFYLTDGNGERTILLQNCSTLPYSSTDWTDISARWDMPVAVYYHCDFTVGQEEDTRTAIENVEAFRQKHGYSFVMENQLMYATAAAYNMTVDVTGGVGEDGVSLTLTAGAENNLAALYDGDYQTSTGVRVSLGEALADEDIAVDADIWRRDGDDIYLSLNRSVSLTSGEQGEGAHITRANLPAMISTTDTSATVKFTESGMMEVAVEGEAYTTTDGWAISESGAGETVFTCYDTTPRTINITFGEEA